MSCRFGTLDLPGLTALQSTASTCVVEKTQTIQGRRSHADNCGIPSFTDGAWEAGQRERHIDAEANRETS